MTVLFAFDLKEAFSELINGCLMVAGGFMVGYFLGGVIAWAAGKWILRQTDTTSLKKLGRPVGGIMLALIVALIVFTGKGKPQGDGGDGKGTTNTDQNAGKNATPKTDTDPKLPPTVTPPKPPDPTVTDVILQVTVYGGATVVEGRYYQLNKDTTLKTFAELKEVILARKSIEKGKIGLEIRDAEKDALPQDHPAVTQVVKWARQVAKLNVTFVADR